MGFGEISVSPNLKYFSRDKSNSNMYHTSATEMHGIYSE